MRYQDLDVYKRSYSLAVQIHKLSLGLPKELQYDLGSQIRRASRSVPSNIAEGLGKATSTRDKINFLRTSLGSNEEMLFNIDFMRDVELLNKTDYDILVSEFNTVGKEIIGLIARTNRQ